MTTEELAATFKRLSEEYIKFNRIQSPRHPRPDVCAFLMLHDLAPCPYDEGRQPLRDMVAAADIDKVWLATDVATLAAVATDENVADLLRCGVLFDEDTDSLCMFV